jgi:HAD superfamily hydrolase (TIGR01509 family)
MNDPKSGWNMRCVIYDCDGVLFDSLEANTRLYNDLCIRMGRAPLREDEKYYVHTRTVFEAIRFIFKGEEGLEKRALESIKEMDLRNYIVYLRMEPHLLQALNLLRAKGILRAINTNRTTSMPHIMERFGLWPFFDMVVTALDVTNPKPHPESVQKILRTLSLEREEAVFIGDSEVDQQAAKAAGIRFIAYKNREIANDAYLEDHLALVDFL